MSDLQLSVRQELEALADPKYQKFAAALIPGVKNLIGVRIPLLRKLAKTLVKKEGSAYLANSEVIYFEEVMLAGFVICELKDDIDVVLKEIEAFIPSMTAFVLI